MNGHKLRPHFDSIINHAKEERPTFPVKRNRGKVLSSQLAPSVLAMFIPLPCYEQPDEAAREREYGHFVADLRTALKTANEK
ncbi:MAG: hypothetical protein ABI925_04915 [Verrucomicrobiota bacterium]